jgi:hypothetical protein
MLPAAFRRSNLSQPRPQCLSAGFFGVDQRMRDAARHTQADAQLMVFASIA